MGFKANSSDTPVVTEGKLYTGLANMRVIGINPDKAGLEELGYRPQNEPVYLSKDNDTGVDKLRLDFHMEGKTPDGLGTVRSKIAFFLENQHRQSRDGKKGEWINDLGRTAWGTAVAPPTEYKWFEHQTARPCKVGENELHLFLINWLNIQPGDEAKMENFEALFTGNYSELMQLLANNSNNEVRVLLCVREGKYQSIYTRYFDRATNTKTSYWSSHVEKQTKQGYPPKEDFQGDFAFKEWIEPTMVETVDPDLQGADPTAEDDPF